MSRISKKYCAHNRAHVFVLHSDEWSTNEEELIYEKYWRIFKYVGIFNPIELHFKNKISFTLECIMAGHMLSKKPP